jgi:dipeptidyl aminopeptidase/acylaminoacyl peptidase
MSRIALGLLLAITAAAQKRPITHDDIWLMKRVGEPVVSPDGRSVVFSVTEPDYDPAKQTADLWVAPTDGSAPPRRLTFSKAAESGAVWSPDGTRLAFATKREGDETPQIYLLPLSAGEARRVTSAQKGASNPQWRPDGKAILYESAYDPLGDERKQRKSTARAYDAMPVRYWNAWLDENTPHIFVQELEEGSKAGVLRRDIFCDRRGNEYVRL